MKKSGILVVFLIMLVFATAPAVAASPGKVLYVDNDSPADFNNIQAAIDDAHDDDVVIVAPGTYTGDGNRDIDFKGKAITVKSEEGPKTCIIDCQGSFSDSHRGFYFHSGEGADSVLQGFTITNGYRRRDEGGGIYCNGSSAYITECIVTGNFAPAGGGIACHGSSSLVVNCIIRNNWASEGGGIAILGEYKDRSPMFNNCIISGNTSSGSGAGVSCAGDVALVNCTISGNRSLWDLGAGIACGTAYWNKAIVRNSIVWDNIAQYSGNTAKYGTQIAFVHLGILGVMQLEIHHSVVGEDPNAVLMTAPSGRDYILGEWILADPLFVQPGYWDPNERPDLPGDDFWVDGDYHLKSQAGRWDPNSQAWVRDDVTSPCIDAGDMSGPIGYEPFPNGGIINMGAYGRTAEASKTYFGKSVCETIVAGDVNGDCIIDFKDFTLMALHRLHDSDP